MGLTGNHTGERRPGVRVDSRIKNKEKENAQAEQNNKSRQQSLDEMKPERMVTGCCGRKRVHFPLFILERGFLSEI
ncbi:MAG: hypothetical protein ACYC36_14215 [Bellilinea sp.]